MSPSATYQQIIIQGILERDPEFKSLSSGTSLANLTVVTEDSYKDKQQEWKTKKEWHKVVVFGKNTGALSGSVKGDMVVVIGKNETRSWEQDGVKKYSTEVKADKIFPLGPAAEGSSEPSGYARAAAPARASAAPAARVAAPVVARSTDYTETGITDDDIPF